MNFKYVVVLSLLWPFMGFAQQRKIKDPKLTSRVDSLIVIMVNANTVAEKVEIEREVYDLSKAIGYRDGITGGKLNLIAGLNALGKQDQALKLIDESMVEAAQFNDPSYTIELLNLKASCYSMLGFFDESRAVLNQATSVTLKLKDNNAYRYALGKIDEMIAWNIEAANGNPDSTLFYLRNGSQQYAKLTTRPEINNSFFVIQTRIGMAYFEKKQYDSAGKYLSCFYKIKEEYRKNDKIDFFSTYLTDARLKYIRKDYQGSLTAYQSALALSTALKLPYYQKLIYNDLVQLYDKLHDQKNETFFLKKYAVVTDSLSRIEKKGMRQPLETIIKNKNNAENNEKTRYISIITVITILVAGFIFFHNYKKRIEMKGRAEARGTEEVQGRLIPANNSNILNELIELAKQNNPVLYARFNEFDPAFCKKLLGIAPNLLIPEQELCIYIRLNFETKEIARYAKFSVKAIQAKKHRLRKKLKILPKEDIVNWIINI